MIKIAIFAFCAGFLCGFVFLPLITTAVLLYCCVTAPYWPIELVEGEYFDG